MNAGEIIKEIRTKNGLTQDDLAEKLFVTRQAVSRWENGETFPNTETLKAISELFDISVNTLLGQPRKLICQCCGMELSDDSFSHEPDGTVNQKYCKWCYTDGEFVYKTLDELIDFLSVHLSNESFTPEQARAYFSSILPQLEYWQAGDLKE